MRILKEFKEFAMRGNVVDLAVGVVIGGAFGKIVTSIKAMNTLKRRLAPVPVLEPATKDCPECLSPIPLKAKRCSHCGQLVP